jgi:glucokinase
MDLVGAVDVGGTKIAVGLVDESGQILEQEVCPTAPEKGFADGMARIQTMLANCLARRPGSRLLGVGVGCTGPVDPLTGVLGPKSFLPLWEGIGLVDYIQSALGASVAIENDADAAALGEVAWGAGQGFARCLYVTVSTGIGCGIVLDHKLYRGAGGAHPEMGHITLEPTSGPLCYCDNRGCWESLASGMAMADWYKSQLRERGQSAPAGSGEVDAREICRRAGLGDELAQAAVEREGFYLGAGLANLVTTFIPDVIVLGGGVMESWSLFQNQVHEIIRRSCSLVPYERTELRHASLGIRTGLAGAAQVWFHRFR